MINKEKFKDQIENHTDGYNESWWNFFVFKGRARTRPYSAYMKWMKKKGE